jgi:hypothetical protein
MEDRYSPAVFINKATAENLAHDINHLKPMGFHGAELVYSEIHKGWYVAYLLKDGKQWAVMNENFYTLLDILEAEVIKKKSRIN